MATSITLTNVTKKFGAGPEATTAADRVNAHIREGELFFLLGPSGCGKTTLLRMIAGFIDPTGGTIAFGERDVTYTPPNKRNTGMVFQSYALWPHMTVGANVGFGLGIRRVAPEERSKRVKEALGAVHMAEYADRKPNSLSGGQQQRVALARALVIRPDVLLLDEPLSNLDAKLRIELRSEIRRICKESGITTVYVTHDQKEALSMADRIAILDAGRVIQIGSPSDLYRNPANEFVAAFLGETNFIPGLIKSRENGQVTVETPAGDLVSTHPGGRNLDAAREVVCSIRPEAVRLRQAAAANAMTGRLVQTTYLGEIAQHHLELPGHTDLKVSELNPDVRLLGGAGSGDGQIQVSIAPEDVVILTDG